MAKILNIKSIILIGVLLFLPSFISAQNNEGIQFSFGYNEFDKYRIEGTNTQSIYLNGNVIEEDIVIKNIITVGIGARELQSINIDYTMETIENGLLISEKSSKFTQYANGNTVVPKQFSIPLIRNIPLFPNIALVDGTKWSAIGQDNILLPEANVNELLNVSVEYVYLGFQNIPSRASELASNKEISMPSALPLIRAKYSIDKIRLFNAKLGEYQTYSANHDINIWWNNIDNRIAYYDEMYNIQVSYENGATFTFEGKADGIMLGVRKLNKSLLNIKKALEEQFDDIEITSNEKGITISMQNIQFLPDSSQLQAKEQEKVKKIAKILAQYPRRRILIEGHTALGGNEYSREQLSIKRAYEVFKLLREFTQFDRNQFLYRGWGAERPVASNYTDEGKAMNRRVEITILEN